MVKSQMLEWLKRKAGQKIIYTKRRGGGNTKTLRRSQFGTKKNKKDGKGKTCCSQFGSPNKGGRGKVLKGGLNAPRTRLKSNRERNDRGELKSINGKDKL